MSPNLTACISSKIFRRDQIESWNKKLFFLIVDVHLREKTEDLKCEYSHSCRLPRLKALCGQGKAH